MITITLRELRNNFSKLEAWLEEGEQIQVQRRGTPIAMLTGISQTHTGEIKRPSFAERRKAIWGDRVFSDDEVAAMRAEEREGEEG